MRAVPDRGLRRATRVRQIAAPIQVPAAGTIEVAFAPDESAQVLEIKVIDSARTSLDMPAYNRTSPRVASPLLRARRRGVAERIVDDRKQNIDDDRYGKSKRVLTELVAAGAASLAFRMSVGCSATASTPTSH